MVCVFDPVLSVILGALFLAAGRGFWYVFVFWLLRELFSLESVVVVVMPVSCEVPVGGALGCSWREDLAVCVVCLGCVLD